MNRISTFIFTGLLGLTIIQCGTKKNTVEVGNDDILLDTFKVSSVPQPKVYHPSEKRVVNLLHTKLDVRFSWEKRFLFGKAWLTFKPYYYPVDSFRIDAKGFDLHKISLVDKKGNLQDLPYRYEDSLEIVIFLPRTFQRNDTFTLFVDYTAKPDLRSNIGGSEAISSDKGLYFINPLGTDSTKPKQIWTQGETEANSCWFPTIDAPNERTTQEIYITVEDQYKTLSNGLLVSSKKNGDGTRTDYWVMDKPHAPYLFMMAIGDYAVVKEQWQYKDQKPIELSYWVEKEYEPYAKDIFGRTPKMLTFYSDVLKFPYPWQKYAQVIVRDYVSGAMENTTAVIHGEFVQQTRQEMVDGNHDDIIAHELFHHWFGDWVTCESWANLPLNESFATYGEYLWLEYDKGREEADLHLHEDLRSYLNEASEKQVDLIRFDYTDREDMFDRHSYAKGGRVLHMLRKYVGDEAFFDALNLYLRRHALSPVEIHHLRLAFEDVTGEDLNWFFNQWFLASGHPVLEIETVYNDSAKKVIVKISQLQDFESTPLYKLPMNVDIYYNGTKTTHSIVLELAEQYFDFDCPVKPDWVIVDAEKMLLCEKVEEKPIEERIFQYLHGPLFLDRLEALQDITVSNNPEAKKTHLKALDDRFWYLREYAVKKCKNLLTEYNQDLYTKLKQLLKNDPSSKVRRAALEALVKYYYNEPDAKQLFLEAFNDSSFRVLSMAIVGLYKTDRDLGMAYASKYENYKNSEIISTLSELYSYDGDPSKINFYRKAFQRAGSYEKYTLASHYSDYLKIQKPDFVLNNLDLLQAVAKDQSAWWVRLGGILGLNNLKSSFEETNKLYEDELKKLKATEPAALEYRQKIEDNNKVVERITQILEELKQTETNTMLKILMEYNNADLEIETEEE